MKKISLLILAALGGTICPLARAYEYDKHNGDKIYWRDTSQKMRMSEVSFPEGSIWSEAFEEAIARWYDNPSPFYFFTAYGEGSVDVDNSQNEVWFSDDADILGRGDDRAPAITLTWSRGTRLTAADIVFDVEFDFTVSDSPSRSLAYTGSERTFVTTCLHELGHALGLDHENDEYSQMGESWTHVSRNGDTLHFYPGEDACDGAVFLYGTVNSGYEDVSVTHWKYLGRDGEYSTHQRTKVYDSSGNALTVHSGTEDDPAYEVTNGQVVKPEFTFENNGRSTQSPTVGWYLSSNNTISTLDTLLGTSVPTISRNDVFTTTKSITLPSTLTRGSYYWLGVVIDKDDDISERNESNNASHITHLREVSHLPPSRGRKSRRTTGARPVLRSIIRSQSRAFSIELGGADGVKGANPMPADSAPQRTGQAVFLPPALRGPFTRLASTPSRVSEPRRWAAD